MRQIKQSWTKTFHFLCYFFPVPGPAKAWRPLLPWSDQDGNRPHVAGANERHSKVWALHRRRQVLYRMYPEGGFRFSLCLSKGTGRSGCMYWHMDAGTVLTYLNLFLQRNVSTDYYLFTVVRVNQKLNAIFVISLGLWLVLLILWAFELFIYFYKFIYSLLSHIAHSFSYT